MIRTKQNKSEHISIGKYLKQKLPSSIFYVILNIAYYLLDFLCTLKIAEFIAEISIGNFETSLNILFSFGIMVIANQIIYLITCFIYNITAGWAVEHVKKDIVSRIFRFSSSAFSKSDSGKIVSRVTRDPNDSFKMLDSVIESLAVVVSQIVIAVYVSIKSYWLGIIIFASFIIMPILEYFKNKVHYRENKKLRAISDSETLLTNEIIRSEKDIKSLNLEDKLTSISSENFEKYKKQYIRKSNITCFLWILRRILSIVITIVLLTVGFFEVKNTGLTIAAFLFLYSNRDLINDFTYFLGSVFTNTTEFKLGFDRINEMFNVDKYPIESFGIEEIESFQGNLSFKDVTFAYDENEKNVLNNMTFDIHGGQTVAFVGKSGSGKTTILNLVSKLYTVVKGEILVDNHNINDLSKNFLKENFCLINQFPYIFNSTIRENLLMAKPDATDEELINVCRQASLASFLDCLEKGIDTRVGEGGINLSGGQKQRLAIARALLKNSKIIIFDESTSSLDNISQEDIKRTISLLAKDHTIIIVAHRLSTIKEVDNIFFVENGQISDSGTFENLFNNNEQFKIMFLAENNN